MKQIGKRSPRTAQRISRMRGAVKRSTQRFGQCVKRGWCSLVGGRKAGGAKALPARTR